MCSDEGQTGLHRKCDMQHHCTLQNEDKFLKTKRNSTPYNAIIRRASRVDTATLLLIRCQYSESDDMLDDPATRDNTITLTLYKARCVRYAM